MSFNHNFYKDPYFIGLLFMFIMSIIAIISIGTPPNLLSWQWWLAIILGIAWVAVSFYLGTHPPKNHL
ncbi:hypothetical protein [Lentilactobacillus kisonensis]|uniref:hypothetical protein n=1 Tax=Lentilactobacillus kisonensis TaxID=481722 RepID=UPI00058EA1FD|nr:hypothetical protein [Lentilactobacillus kisonensis]